MIKKLKIPSWVSILLGIFCIMLLLLFLHWYNLNLNNQVSELQDQLEKVNSEIDSKEGQILSNADLKTIEAQARALGMTEAQPNQYLYEASAQKKNVVVQSQVGLYDYIQFFKAYRNEKLWRNE